MRKSVKIEDLRIRLNILAAARNFNLQDPDVLSLSMELDRLIVDFQQAKQCVLQRPDYKEQFSCG